MLPSIKYNLGSLHFIFNYKSASYLLDKIKSLEIGDKVEIEILGDILLRVSIIKENDFVFYKNNSVKLWISEETKEYLEYKLNDFLVKKDFYPAEAGSFQKVNSSMSFRKRKIIDLYFIKEI